LLRKLPAIHHFNITPQNRHNFFSGRGFEGQQPNQRFRLPAVINYWGEGDSRCEI
jgi:hypothetical protein